MQDELKRRILDHYHQIRFVAASPESLQLANDRLRQAARRSRLAAAVFATDLAARPAQVLTLAVTENGEPFALEDAFDAPDAVNELDPARHAVDHILKPDHRREVDNFARAVRFFGLDGAPPAAAEMSARHFVQGLSTELLDFLGGPERAMERFVSAERQRVQRLAETLAPHLSPDAIRILSHSDEYTAADYVWFAASGQAGERRRQAGGIYGVLAPFLPRSLRVAQAVDEAKPVNPLLTDSLSAEGCSITEGALKRLQNKPFSTRGLELQTLRSLLGAIPPDWVPREEKEWTAFTDAGVVVQRLADETGQPFLTLLEGSRGRWHEFIRNMVFSIDYDPGDDGFDYREHREEILEALADNDTDRRSALLDAAGSVRQMIDAFATRVVLPAAGWHLREAGHFRVDFAYDHFQMARAIAARLLLDKKAAPAILDLGRRFVHHEPRIINAITEEAHEQEFTASTEKEWPGLIADRIDVPASIGDWYIEPITNSSRLKREGWENFNCVGTYADRCRRGTSHILSLRDGNGHVLATVEYGRLQILEKRNLRPLQARGRRRKRSEGDLSNVGAMSLSNNVRATVHDIRQWDLRVTFQRDGATIQTMTLLEFQEACNMIQTHPQRGITLADGTELYKSDVETVVRNTIRRLWSGNTLLSQQMERALEWFEDAVRRGMVPLNPELESFYRQTAGSRSEAASRRDRVREACGYDYSDGRNITRAFDAFARPPGDAPSFLSKKLRKAGARGLVEAEEIKELARALSDEYALEIA